MYKTLTVVDEPVELCVTRLRYAQIHRFSRFVDPQAPNPPDIKLPQKLLPRRVSQAILMTRSDRPSGCRWPAIRRVALQCGPSTP
jgi:hypothetical protein